MASCEPSKCEFCLEASRIESIALRRLEDAKKTKSYYSFWVTHASTIIIGHYDRHKALCKKKVFQDVLKLTANCLTEDYADLLNEATEDETCLLQCCLNRIGQLVQETSDDETLKEMFSCVADLEVEQHAQDDEEGDRKASELGAVALTTSSLDRRSLRKSGEMMNNSSESEPDAGMPTLSASSFKSSAASLKTSDQTSEKLRGDFELWCRTATREDLIKRVQELSFK